MAYPMGYIVRVSPANGRSVEYSHGALWPDENFIGYFWQMTGKQDDGEFSVAHFHEVKRILGADDFVYGRNVEFNVADISIEVCALRAPLSNYSGCKKTIDNLPLWKAVGSE
jgi:hypothetical protein